MLDALQQYKQNDVDSAFQQLKKLQQSDFDNPRIPLTLVKLMFREGRYEEMDKYIQSLPSTLKNNEEIINLTAHAGFIRAAQKVADLVALEQQVAASPDDVELRYQLSAAYLVDDRYIEAMDQLLEIISRDRAYKNDIGVKGMVSILNLIADDVAQVKVYRQKMIDAIAH